MLLFLRSSHWRSDTFLSYQNFRKNLIKQPFAYLRFSKYWLSFIFFMLCNKFSTLNEAVWKLFARLTVENYKSYCTLLVALFNKQLFLFLAGKNNQKSSLKKNGMRFLFKKSNNWISLANNNYDISKSPTNPLAL